MAIKDKSKPEHSKLYEILTKEYRWETYALGIFSAFAIAMGSLMLTNVLAINTNTPIIGDIPSMFAWIVVSVGILGALMFVGPIFKPALPELKKLSFPNRRTFLGNIARVFIFMILLSLIFLLYEAFISGILGKLL